MNNLAFEYDKEGDLENGKCKSVANLQIYISNEPCKDDIWGGKWWQYPKFPSFSQITTSKFFIFAHSER